MKEPAVGEGGATSLDSTSPDGSESAQPQGLQEPSAVSRSELRGRALESRSSYQLGELPGDQQGAEIDLALQKEAEDESTLGAAFQFLVLDDIPDEERISRLKEHFGHNSHGAANGLRQHLDALRFGILPNGTSMAAQIAARMKTTMRRHGFSPSTHEVLERNVAALEKIASDADVFEAEQSKADIAEQSAEDRLRGRVGVYVFTYPHYLRHPTHPSTESEKILDRTLLKVGYADNGIVDRVNQETSGAGVPEHRRILRAYLTSHGETRSGREFERLFHDLLDSAGHAGPKRNSTEYQRGGKEWFYTNVDFLDQLARILNLEIVEIDSPENEL